MFIKRDGPDSFGSALRLADAFPATGVTKCRMEPSRNRSSSPLIARRFGTGEKVDR